MQLLFLVPFLVAQSALASYLDPPDVYYHRCLLHNPHSFFYTYEKEQFGCTLNCFWLEAGPHQEYFERTVSQSISMDGECMDSLHLCKNGKCLVKESPAGESQVYTQSTASMPSTSLTEVTLRPTKYGTVQIHFFEGYFKVYDGTSKGDPYIITFLNGNKVHTTNTIRDSHRVNFDQQFDIGVLCRYNDTLSFTIMDKDGIMDDLICKFTVKLQEDILEPNKSGKVLRQVWPNGNWLNYTITWTNDYS